MSWIIYTIVSAILVVVTLVVTEEMTHMKQNLIRWLLDYPMPAYDSMKQSIWMHKHILLWDRIRVRLARWLMGE